MYGVCMGSPKLGDMPTAIGEGVLPPIASLSRSASNAANATACAKLSASGVVIAWNGPARAAGSTSTSKPGGGLRPLAGQDFIIRSRRNPSSDDGWKTLVSMKVFLIENGAG